MGIHDAYMSTYSSTWSLHQKGQNWELKERDRKTGSYLKKRKKRANRTKQQ
jgi:hypothetical protein